MLVLWRFKCLNVLISVGVSLVVSLFHLAVVYDAVVCPTVWRQTSKSGQNMNIGSLVNSAMRT